MEENFQVFITNLQNEWKDKISGNPDVKRIRLDLEFNRKKLGSGSQFYIEIEFYTVLEALNILNLAKELSTEEAFEQSLVEKERQLVERAKPILMRFHEYLSSPSSIDYSLLEELVQEETWDKVTFLLKRRVHLIDNIDRKSIILVIKSILFIRDSYVQSGTMEAVKSLQEDCKLALRSLGKSSISWSSLEPLEANILVEIFQEIENIPPFMRRLVHYLLTAERDRPRTVVREIATQCDLDAGGNNNQSNLGDRSLTLKNA